MLRNCARVHAREGGDAALLGLAKTPVSPPACGRSCRSAGSSWRSQLWKEIAE